MDQPLATHYIHGWFIFSRNPRKLLQILLIEKPQGVYILAVNGVTRCFRSTANRVHVTAIVTEFTVTKFLGKISKSTTASNINIYQNEPLIVVTFRPDMTSPPTSGTNGPAIVYTSHKWLISYCCRCHFQVADACRCTCVQNVFGTSDRKESITDDSRSVMSGVAFRTAPPIGGLSCFECLKIN